MSETISPYEDIAAQDAVNAGVPPQLFTDLIGAESGWNPNAVSSAGAVGIAQFMPSTATNPGYGVAPFDPSNPEDALQGSADYLAGLHQATGSWESAINAYNTGNPNTQNSYPENVNQDAKTADNGGFLSTIWDSLLPPQINPIAKRSLKNGGTFFSDIGLRLGVGLIAIVFIGLGAASFMLAKPVSEMPGISDAVKMVGSVVK